MAVDIVFPKNNEKAFIGMAAKLGYSALCFAYEKYDSEKRKKLDALRKKTKLGLFAAGKGADLSIMKAGAENRNALEQGRVDIIFGFEEPGGKDFAFSRNSGLNHILCAIAKEKGVMAGFSFSSVLNAKNKPVIIGRMKQNIMLCRKYNVETVIASFATSPYEMRSPHDLAAFFACIGMDSGAARKSLESAALKAGRHQNYGKI